VPAAAPAGVPDRPYPGYPIREGSQHPGHVRWIQARLDYAAHDTALAVDGAFGPRTHRAVVAFQHGHRLVADGIVGPHTWAALNAVR
jgi:peptidoglycan hydrolase-like protein with peptidoglycan-binding domain